METRPGIAQAETADCDLSVDSFSGHAEAGTVLGGPGDNSAPAAVTQTIAILSGLRVNSNPTATGAVGVLNGFTINSDAAAAAETVATVCDICSTDPWSADALAIATAGRAGRNPFCVAVAVAIAIIGRSGIHSGVIEAEAVRVVRGGGN